MAVNLDVKKIGNLEPQATREINRLREQGGPSFRDTLGSMEGLATPSQAQSARSADPLKFSNHAVERMMSRGIKYSPEDVAKLEEAVSRAASKGAKDSLILMNDSALIVSVKNKTVVTVMDKTALKENVFTNIDSTIVM